MTAKAYLMQVRNLDKDIRAKEEHIQLLRERMNSIGGGLRQDKVQSTLDHDPLGSAYANYDAMLREYQASVDRMKELKREVQSTIDSLDNPDYRAVLTERYINNKKWDDVARCSHYEVRQATRIHGRALQAIAKKMS